jgi:hypothetical protein
VGADDDTRLIRETEEMHRVVAASLPEPVDIVAMDVSVAGLRIIAMSESVRNALHHEWVERGHKGDLRTELSKIAERATQVPPQESRGIGPTYESTIHLASRGKTERVLIEQFMFSPGRARMYYPIERP